MPDSPASSTSPPLGSRPYTEIDRTFGRHFHAPFHAQRQSVSSAASTRKMMPPYSKTLTALGWCPPTRTLENCSTNGGNYQGIMLDGKDPRWAWEPFHEYKFPEKKWCSRHSDYDGSHLTVYRRIHARPVTEAILMANSKELGSAMDNTLIQDNAVPDFGSGLFSNDPRDIPSGHQQSSGPDSDNYKAFLDCETDYPSLCRPAGPFYEPQDPTVVWEPQHIGYYIDPLFCQEHNKHERFVESIYRKVPENASEESPPEPLLSAPQASDV